MSVEEEGEANMPEGLLADAEDGYGFYAGASRDEQGGGECGTEGGYFFGVEKACGFSGVVHYGECALWCYIGLCGCWMRV
jgi:hypothetical protein